MKILVLLAAYNGEKFIEEQIDSILGQKDVTVTLQVSDDNSKDNTINLVKKYPNISLNKNEIGTGSAATNFLKMIKELDFNNHFDYIALSDQDDIWLSDKLRVAVEKLEQESVDLYCSNLTKWNKTENSYSNLKKDFPQKKFDYLFEGGSAGCTYVFTKIFAIELQKFIFQLEYSNWKEFSHDWLIYFFARSRKYKVFIDSNSYIHYRLHNDNVHGHLNVLSFQTIKYKLGEVFNNYYQNHVENYIKYVEINSEEYNIYQKFLGNYFQRNFIVLKYNTQLMRDNKKFLLFAVLNLLKLR